MTMIFGQMSRQKEQSNFTNLHSSSMIQVRFNVPESSRTLGLTITEADKRRTASTDTPSNRTFTSGNGEGKPVDYKRLDTLYQNGVNKKKRFEMMDKVKKEEAIKKEIEACTFKPKLNTKYKPMSGNVLNSDVPIYERQALWHEKKVEK
jgi:hypothetical protein